MLEECNINVPIVSLPSGNAGMSECLIKQCIKNGYTKYILWMDWDDVGYNLSQNIKNNFEKIKNEYINLNIEIQTFENMNDIINNNCDNTPNIIQSQIQTETQIQIEIPTQQYIAINNKNDTKNTKNFVKDANDVLKLKDDCMRKYIFENLKQKIDRFYQT